MFSLQKRAPENNIEEAKASSSFDSAAANLLPPARNITQNILTIMRWQKTAMTDMELCNNTSGNAAEWNRLQHALDNLDYSPQLKNLFRDNEALTAAALGKELLSIAGKKKDAAANIYSRMGEEGRLAWLNLSLRLFYDQLRMQVFGADDIDHCPLKDPQIRISNPAITDNRETITYGRLLRGDTGPLYIKKETLEKPLSGALEDLYTSAAFYATRQLTSLHYQGKMQPLVDEDTTEDVWKAYETIERDFEIIRLKTNFDFSASPQLIEVYNKDPDYLLTARHGQATSGKTMLLLDGKTERAFGKIDRMIDRRLSGKMAMGHSPLTGTTPPRP